MPKDDDSGIDLFRGLFWGGLAGAVIWGLIFWKLGVFG